MEVFCEIWGTMQLYSEICTFVVVDIISDENREIALVFQQYWHSLQKRSPQETFVKN